MLTIRGDCLIGPLILVIRILGPILAKRLTLKLDQNRSFDLDQACLEPQLENPDLEFLFRMDVPTCAWTILNLQSPRVSVQTLSARLTIGFLWMRRAAVGLDQLKDKTRQSSALACKNLPVWPVCPSGSPLMPVYLRGRDLKAASQSRVLSEDWDVERKASERSLCLQGLAAWHLCSLSISTCRLWHCSLEGSAKHPIVQVQCYLAMAM